jgi:hypothetical protein
MNVKCNKRNLTNSYIKSLFHILHNKKAWILNKLNKHEQKKYKNNHLILSINSKITLKTAFYVL